MLGEVVSSASYYSYGYCCVVGQVFARWVSAVRWYVNCVCQWTYLLCFLYPVCLASSGR
jgi:hypothetical protein